MKKLIAVLLMLILPSTVLASGVPKGRDQQLATIFALDLRTTQNFYYCNTKKLCLTEVVQFATYDLAFMRRVGTLMKNVSSSPCNREGLKLANTTLLGKHITLYSKGKLSKKALLKTQTTWLLQAVRTFKVC